MPAFSETIDLTGTILGPLGFQDESPMVMADNFTADVSVHGIPFILKADKDTPYFRQSVAPQKQQFDSSGEAGEQTLGQYWQRSQDSWHRGAGSRWYEPGKNTQNSGAYEPGSDELSQYRFEHSVGINTWDKTEAKLLKRMALTGAVTGSQVAFCTTGKLVDGTDVIFVNENGTVKRRTAGGGSTSYTGSTSLTTPVAIAGSVLLVGLTTGIYSGSISGTTIASLWTIAAGANVVPYYVKGRIIAAVGPSLYELTLAGGAMVAGQIIHTHPDANWTWSGVTEGPLAIYAAGFAGSKSAIYKFTLQDAAAGTLPRLGQAYEVAVTPSGEQIHSISSYLGTYFALGTNRGIRVGLLDGNGNLNYGPLTVETSQPVRSLEGNESFIYASVQDAIDGKSGAVRINLGMPLPHEELRFAYSFDAQTKDTGVVTSIAFFGSTERVCLGVTGKGVYTQSDTLYEATGYILGGRIRFATTEMKKFRAADVCARVPGGTVVLSILDENASESNLITMNPTATDGMDVSLSSLPGDHEYVQFRITLTCDTATSLITPTMICFRVRALPAPRRQWLIQYPLNCVDKEQDAFGVPFGHEGYAWERIQMLQDMLEHGTVVTVSDFTNGETFEGTVEQVEFVRTWPRSADGYGNFGGILKATFRKL